MSARSTEMYHHRSNLQQQVSLLKLIINEEDKIQSKTNQLLRVDKSRLQRYE